MTIRLKNILDLLLFYLTTYIKSSSKSDLLNKTSFSILLQDLEKFVNDSGDDGFVIFSLGSAVDSIPEDRAKLFFFDRFRKR